MGTQPHAIASAHHGKRRKAAACSAATTGISQTDASSIASSSDEPDRGIPTMNTGRWLARSSRIAAGSRAHGAALGEVCGEEEYAEEEEA